MPKAAPQVELTQQQIDAIAAWEKAKCNLDAAKSEEMIKRLEAIKLAPFDADKEEGSQSVKLGAGYTLKLDRPISYSMDKDNQAVMAALSNLSAGTQRDELIRWEAVISTGVYKKLSDEDKLALAPVLTMKPGTPSLTLTPPAPKKA